MTTQSKSRKAAAPLALASALPFAVIAALLLGGCLSKPALKRQTYAFQSPPPAATSSQSGGVVAVQPVTVSALFEGQSFVYRTGAESYEADPYAGFLIAPARAISIAIRAHLLNSGRFSDVVEPGGPRAAGAKFVKVYVTELYGDFTNPSQPAAILSTRVSFSTTGDTSLPKNYSRRIPIQEKTAAAVMSGWDKALTEISSEMAADLAASR